jgi:hypothetical protein
MLSIKAEREWFDPAMRSILAKTSPESVIDAFFFILLICRPRTIHASRSPKDSLDRPGRQEFEPCAFKYAQLTSRWASGAEWLASNDKGRRRLG